jgi:hypothetical protein
MMVLKGENLLIFVIIVLVSSITPVAAVESSRSDNVSDDWNDGWSRGMAEFSKAFNEEKYTELTLEQQQYLEAHEDGVQSKGDAVLQNIQDYINYALNEYSNYNTSKLQKRSENNQKYDKEFNEIISFLKNSRIPVETRNHTYNSLLNNWNDTRNGSENYAGHNMGVIVQIDETVDENHYIRYVEVLNITKDNITLHHDNKDFTVHGTVFENLYLHDGVFRVILVSKDYDSSNVLHKILAFKRDVLTAKISRCNVAQSAFISFISLGASSIALVGIWKCCDGCKGRAYNVISRTETVGEGTRLLETSRETAVEVGSGSCSMCRKPATIMATGAFITLSAIMGLAVNNELRIAYEKDLKNLNEYIK